MKTYRLKLSTGKLPAICDTYSFRSPEDFEVDQVVLAQTSQGLIRAKVVKLNCTTVSTKLLKQWVPRAYSSAAEKRKQKRAAGITC